MRADLQVRRGGKKARKRFSVEDATWHRIASEIGCSVATARRIVGSSEYVDWVAYFETRGHEFEPLYWYLAQVAYEVRRASQFESSNVKSDMKLEDFILKFKTKEKEKPLPPAIAARNAAKIWMARLGLTKGGKLKTKKPPRTK